MTQYAGAVVVSRLETATGSSSYSGDRVYPVILPQDAALPAFTYQVITAPREHAMSVDEGTVHARVQVDVYDTTYLGTASGGKHARDALNRFRGTATGITVHEILLDNERDAFEDKLEGSERRVWRRSMDYLVHYVEE